MDDSNNNSTVVQRKLDFTEEFLTCSICENEFGEGDCHHAKLLPCHHTYCASCLNDLSYFSDNGLQVKCPKCRMTVSLPAWTVESLPNNFIVESLKEYQNDFKSTKEEVITIPCENCDSAENQPAVKICYDCHCFLCKCCEFSHGRMQSLRHHKVSAIPPLQKEQHHPVTQERCAKANHSQSYLNLYCKTECCHLPICSICGHDEHQHHDVVNIKTAIGEIAADIETRILTIHRQLSHVFCLQEFAPKESHLHQHHIPSFLRSLYRIEAFLRHANLKTSAMDDIRNELSMICHIALYNDAKDNEGAIHRPTLLLPRLNNITVQIHKLENRLLPPKPAVRCSITDQQKYPGEKTTKGLDIKTTMKKTLCVLFRVLYYVAFIFIITVVLMVFMDIFVSKIEKHPELLRRLF